MKKNKTSLKYQCKIFDVWEEEIDLPNGKAIQQSWINHNPTVAIIAINDKNELMLIKQYRAAVKKIFWRFRPARWIVWTNHLLTVRSVNWPKKPGLKLKLLLNFLRLFIAGILQ